MNTETHKHIVAMKDDHTQRVPHFLTVIGRVLLIQREVCLFLLYCVAVKR